MKDVIEKSKQLILHTLLPKEKQVMKKIQSLDKEIIDYGKVLEILELKDFSKCNIDLGLHYFVNAKVKNTEYLYLDIGLGVLVEVNDQEARIIIPKQIAHLQRYKFDVLEM